LFPDQRLRPFQCDQLGPIINGYNKVFEKNIADVYAPGSFIMAGSFDKKSDRRRIDRYTAYRYIFEIAHTSSDMAVVADIGRNAGAFEFLFQA
jgi:hypothetical protein